MTSIGETLRRERVRQGLDFQQVSESTKIGTRMLQAMEADDFTKLPGGVFTRSFIRQYATVLGIDPAALEPNLEVLHVAGDENTRFDTRLSDIGHESGKRPFGGLSDRGPEPNSLLASAVWVLVALVVCGAVYYVLNRNIGTPRAEQQNAPSASPDAGSSPAGAVPDAKLGTPAASANPASEPVQVVLSASEPAWVSVTADGKPNYVGVLEAHQKKEINASEKVRVVSGNAGGLEISLNGKPIEAIGPRGQIRTVELTQSGAQVIPRTPPNPSPLL